MTSSSSAGGLTEGLSEGLTEGEKKELIEIHEHIRSLSSLGQLLRDNNTFLTRPRAPNEPGQTNPIVGMLENLAQCLVRERLENASVGMFAKQQIVASVSTPVVDTSFVEKTSFNELRSATNTAGKTSRTGKGSEFLINKESHKIEKDRIERKNLIMKSLTDGEGIDGRRWPSISKLVYQYRSQRVQTQLETYPSFHLHALVSFDFLKCVLDIPPDEKDRRAAGLRSFCMFITGMGFAKFGYRLEDPPASSCTTSVTEYLEKPLFSQDFKDVKDASLDDKTIRILQHFFIFTWTTVALEDEAAYSEIKLAIDQLQLSSNKKFTTLVAAGCHFVLRTQFQRIQTSYEKLDEYSPPESKIKANTMTPPKSEDANKMTNGIKAFEEHLPEIVFALEFFTFFAEGGLMDLYIESTKIPPSVPQTPKDQQRELLDVGEDEDFQDCSDWPQTFARWIRRLVRQFSSAKRLAHLTPIWKKKISNLEMGIVIEDSPLKNMEPWSKTIKAILARDYSNRYRICTQVISSLSNIAMNASGDKKFRRALWAPLVKSTDDRDWKDSFWGQVHGEAAIAALYAQNQEPNHLQYYGVSKHCCLCCAILIDIVARDQGYSASVAAHTFLGRSHKWWRWALPSQCPLNVARKVSEALDTEMYEVLQQSSPELARISKLFGTGSSQDETSRGNYEDDDYDRALPGGTNKTSPPVFDPKGTIRKQV